jgi:multidrug efflux pump
MKNSKDLKVVITGDQSKATKTSFNDLVNTIIIGFVLVLLVLMFFMGVTNAFFVALSVPLSVFVAFMFLPLLMQYRYSCYTELHCIVWFAYSAWELLWMMPSW